jgi:hypothetical protein
MRIPESSTTQTVRRCSLHQTIEVLPDVWMRDTFVSWLRNQHARIEEAACPTCLQAARDALQQQFPALYASAPLRAQHSG